MPCLLQFAIASVVDLRLPAGQHVGWRHESNGAVQPHGVAVVQLLLSQSLGSPPILWRLLPSCDMLTL